MENMICYCNDVTEERIIEAITGGARTLDEIRRATGAGTGNECAVKNPKGVCCVKDIQAILSRHNPDASASSCGCGCC